MVDQIGGLAQYTPPTADFNPYTYGQQGNPGWLFYKRPVQPVPPVQAVQMIGVGGDAPVVDRAYAPMGGDGGASANEGVGGYSDKGFFEGLATYGSNMLGVLGGPLGLVSMGYGIANNNENLSTGSMLQGLYGSLFGGSDGGDAGWGGGDNGMAGDPGSGTGDSGSAFAATGGLVTSRGVVKPYAQGGLVNGMIQGPGGGQDDLVPMTVPSDSYVIPADVVAGLGDGNAFEGSRRLMKAVGGSVGHGGLASRGVPVAVSPSESVIGPDAVARLGRGNIDAGERRLDQFVKNVRKHKTSQGSGHPPKAKSPESYLKGR